MGVVIDTLVLSYPPEVHDPSRGLAEVVTVMYGSTAHGRHRPSYDLRINRAISDLNQNVGEHSGLGLSG